jgi:hypothetical protein
MVISIRLAGPAMLAVLMAFQPSSSALADTYKAPVEKPEIEHDFISEELNELDNWGGLVRIDKTSRKLQFEEGLSPYQVVKLPAVTTPYWLRAELTYPGVRDDGVLWPLLLLLDHTGKVIDKVTAAKEKDGKPLTLSSRVTVQIDPAKVFFVVFYSNPDDAEKLTTVAWTRVNDTLYVKTKFSQVGELQIYLTKLTTKCRFSSNLDKCQPH